MTASEISSLHGIASVLVGIALPVVLWFLILKSWRPTSRPQYSARFALWPVIILSFSLGGPISRALFGIHSSYQMGLGETLRGLLVLAVVAAPVFFAIGWWRSKRFFGSQASSAPNP